MALLILCTILGFFIIVLTIRGDSSSPAATTGAGILLIVIGVVGYLMSENVVTSEKDIHLCLYIFAHSLATLLAVGGVIRLRKVFFIQKKVEAELVEKESSYVGRYHQYKLVFSYKYNNHPFKSTTVANVSWWTAARLKEGKKYNVRINPKQPSAVVYGHGINILDICIWVTFILFILVPVWVDTGFI